MIEIERSCLDCRWMHWGDVNNLGNPEGEGECEWSASLDMPDWVGDAISKTKAYKVPREQPFINCLVWEPE